MSDLITIDKVPDAPQRPLDAHKGTFGTVIVVGGCQTMIGAPALCARAAFRAGAGLVKIATTSNVLPHTLTIEPSATGIVLDSDDWSQTINEADPDGKAVLAVGPGMGLAAGNQQRVVSLLQLNRPTVLDADGLNLLAQTAKPCPGRKNSPLILTPHPGEFARLAEPLGIKESPTHPDSRPQAAAKLAQAHNAVVLLKGRNTVVTDGKRVYINDTGNPALATAGSGDILTGLIAALLAQHMSAFDAAVLGAYLHGEAADQWARDHSPRGLRAQELADQLISVINLHQMPPF